MYVYRVSDSFTFVNGAFVYEPNQGYEVTGLAPGTAYTARVFPFASDHDMTELQSEITAFTTNT